jgi:hypothetical protein
MDEKIKIAYQKMSIEMNNIILEAGLPITNVKIIDGIKHILINGNYERN